MPTYGAEMPIHRVPSGFPGPGGIGWAPCAHSEPAGGYHHGFNCLLITSNLPSGVGYCERPVATLNSRISLGLLPTRYRYSWFDPRRITIARPRPVLVTLASISSNGSSIAPR